MSLLDNLEEEIVDGAPFETETQEGLLPPNQNDILIGHEKIERNLLNAIQQNELPHALIFSGLKGIGKATVAYQLAKYLLSSCDEKDSFKNPKNHPAIQLILAGSHPDLMVVEPSETGKADIKIDAIRPVIQFFQKTASEGGWRIVIIDGAETMNIAAQNALLKTLEEPPEKSLIVLITNSVSRLLPTIRSRCRHIPFAPLSQDHLVSLIQLSEQTDSSLNQEQLISTAQGSFSRLQNFLDEDRQTMMKDFFDLFDGFPQINRDKLHKLSDVIASDNKGRKLKDWFAITDWFFNDFIRSLAVGTPLSSLFVQQQNFVQQLEPDDRKIKTDQLIKLRDDFLQMQRDVHALNLDKKTAVISMMMGFEKIA